jgi:hypothetical protein
LTYKPVNNDINALLRDAQKLTYDNVADDILEQPYRNPTKKVYGMFYQMEMRQLIHNFMPPIVRNISLLVLFISMPNLILILLCRRPVILK